MYGYTTLCLSVGGYLSVSVTLFTNIYAQVFVWIYVFSPPIIYLGMELLGHVQLFWGTCQNVFQCDCLICLPTSNARGFQGLCYFFSTLKCIFLIKKAFKKKCLLIVFFFFFFFASCVFFLSHSLVFRSILFRPFFLFCFFV